MSKAEKLRGRLASIQRDREDFEKQKKGLEEEMVIGKQNMGKIKKGLKNTAIIEPIVLTESTASSSGNQSSTEPAIVRKPSQRRESHAATPNMSAMLSPSNNNERSYHGHGYGSGSSSSSASGTGPFSHANTAVIPSGSRISEWCFTGGIDTQPPIVKEKGLYETVRLLGRGSFGEVNLVKNIEDNKLFAIKTIFCAKEGDMTAVMHEVKFLRLSRHPCIIDIHDAFLMVNPKIMHIVMHYCESGSIASYISNAKKNKNSITEAQIIKWTIQLALALHFMHEFNHTLHRDLKPMNVMLTEGGDLVKLCDFGLALNMDDSNKGGDTNDEAGTPYYTAPEMIKGETYSYPADCWSFGIILHQLLTLDRPFDGSNTASLVKSILTEEPPAMPAHYSEDIKAISFGLLHKDPAQRISMSQLLADPFMYSKGSTFPDSYRPKSLEERIRRSHCRTLHYQLERITRTTQKTIVAAYKDHLLLKSQATSPLPLQNDVPVHTGDSPGMHTTPSGKVRKIMSGNNINNSSGVNLTREFNRDTVSASVPPMVRDLSGSNGIGFNTRKYSGHVDSKKRLEGESPIAMILDGGDEETIGFSNRETTTSNNNKAFNSIDPVLNHPTPSEEVHGSIQFTSSPGGKITNMSVDAANLRASMGNIAPHLLDILSNSSAGNSHEFIMPYVESPVAQDSYRALMTNDDLPRDAGAFQFDSPSLASHSVIADMESFLDFSTRTTNSSQRPSPGSGEGSTANKTVEPGDSEKPRAMMGPPPKAVRQVTGNNQDDAEKKGIAGPPSLKRQITGNNEDSTATPKVPGPPILGRQITGPPQLKRNLTGNHTGSSDALVSITEVQSTDGDSTKVWTNGSVRVEANGINSNESFKGFNSYDNNANSSKISVQTDTSSSTNNTHNTHNMMSYGHQYGSSNGLSLNGADQESDLISEGMADMSLGSVDCDDLFTFRDRDNSMTAIEEENTDDLHATLTNYPDSPLNSSISSLGGRKGQEIQSAKEKDTFYLEQEMMNDSINSGD